MSIPVIVFFSSFVLVTAKSFQQKSVVMDKWLAIPPISYVMAYGELATVGIGAVDMVDHGITRMIILGFAMGTGGWLGCYAGMICHNRIFKGRGLDDPD